jgi:hypothetical protein
MSIDVMKAFHVIYVVHAWVNTNVVEYEDAGTAHSGVEGAYVEKDVPCIYEADATFHSRKHHDIESYNVKAEGVECVP